MDDVLLYVSYVHHQYSDFLVQVISVGLTPTYVVCRVA